MKLNERSYFALISQQYAINSSEQPIESIDIHLSNKMSFERHLVDIGC